MGSAQHERAAIPLLLSLVAAIGAFAFGYALGYTSPVGKSLENPSDGSVSPKGLGLTEDQNSLFGSLVNVGAMVGALLGGTVADKFGRVWAMRLASLPFAGGFFLICFATGVLELYFGRVLTGLGIGMISVAVPVYIAEIAPTRLRGGMGAIFQLSVTIGILFAFSIGIPIDGYATLAWIGAIFPCVLFVMTIFLPNTPRWLLARGREDEAERALRLLRGPEADIESEKQTTLMAIQESNKQSKPSLGQLVTGTAGRAMRVAVVLMLFQQFSGINAVVFFASDIFDDAGMSNSNVAALIVAITQVAVTSLAAVIIDKAGRRPLLMTAGIGMSASSCILGYFFYLQNSNIDADGTVAVVFVVMYIAFFSIGLGAIPWLMMGEIFPANIRGLAASVATLINWSCSFIVTETFTSMKQNLTEEGVFWFYAAVCLVGTIYVLFAVPETKGRTLDEIEDYFAGRDTSRKDNSGMGLVKVTGSLALLTVGVVMIIMSK